MTAGVVSQGSSRAPRRRWPAAGRPGRPWSARHSDRTGSRRPDPLCRW